jgi:isopenicillin N synthase-like dioxygenase
MKLCRASDHSSIFEELALHSFCLVQLDDEEVIASLPRVASVLDSWKEQTYDESLEIGRQLEKNGKEFIAVKTGLPSMSMLPTDVGKFCSKLFDEQNRLASRLFCSIALHLEGLKNPEALLEKVGPNDLSESFMHLFRYNKENGGPEMLCESHTDSGLITLIPRALGDPALLCLSRATGQFVNVEESPHGGNVCAILVGETLAALSQGKLVWGCLCLNLFFITFFLQVGNCS